MSRRLKVALMWWAAGCEPGPWAMRFAKYMTVFEALFGRKSERRKRGLTQRLASRVAAVVASAPDRVPAITSYFVQLYDQRSATVHEGALSAEPARVYDAMALGANALSYIARSTLTDDPTFHVHLDTMVNTGQVWIQYGHAKGLDPGM